MYLVNSVFYIFLCTKFFSVKSRKKEGFNT